MWRYPDNTFKHSPPSTVEKSGYIVKFNSLTREEKDALGYNEAVPLKREPFTTYEMEWIKGDDLIYREEVVLSVVDEVARAESEAVSVRVERDVRLAGCDWTQLADAQMTSEDKAKWTAYRQTLRDIPQQSGFPMLVEWPDVAV